MDSHKHNIRKTHITFTEFDDVNLDRLAIDTTYFGEKNSLDRKLEFDFEYCLDCDLRLLDGKPIKTQDILEQEFECFVVKAKKGKYTSSDKRTLQHTDFEVMERLIFSALKFGELKVNK